MGQAERAGHMDVSNTVDVTDPRAVEAAIRDILEGCHANYDFSLLGILVEDFDRLYSGRYPGFRACDIKYHDAQHVLDVTLAMARLNDPENTAASNHYSFWLYILWNEDPRVFDLY